MKELAYDISHDPRDIAGILRISETIAYKYVNDYLTRHKIRHAPRSCSECKLTPVQEIEYDTINGETVIEFFKQLEQTLTYKTIYVICDNGRPYKNKEIQRYLQTSMIKLHFLPADSPNLNQIERL